MLTAFLADAKSTIKARTNRDETGATAVEYGIMVALIAVAIIVAVTFLSGNLQQMMGDAGCQMDGDDTIATDTYDVATDACI